MYVMTCLLADKQAIEINEHVFSAVNSNFYLRLYLSNYEMKKKSSKKERERDRIYEVGHRISLRFFLKINRITGYS